jgi:hypothetical protein
MLRLTGFLILASVVAVSAQAQGVQPGRETPADVPVFQTLGASMVDPVIVAPRNRRGPVSLPAPSRSCSHGLDRPTRCRCSPPTPPLLQR